MADTDTSTSRAQDEADVHEMRAEARRGGRKNGRKRLLVLALIALLAVGSGGGVAYVLFLAPAEPAGETAEEALEPVPVVPAYVDLEPLFVPFRSDGGYRHKIALIMALEVDRAKGDDAMVRARMPRLREAYLRALTERPLPGTADGTIQTVYLKNRIRAENLKILGSGVVNDVLIRDIRVVAE